MSPSDVAAAFESLFVHGRDGVLLARADGTILRANPAACVLLGYSEEAICRLGSAGLVSHDAALAPVPVEGARAGVASGEVRFRRADGSVLVTELSSLDVPGKDEALSVLSFREVTDAHASLQRSNRALRMVTRCDEVVRRASSKPDLFGSVCQMIVDVGGYRMCWIGVPAEDSPALLRPAASAGFEDGYLEAVRRAATSGDAVGLVTRAFVEGRALFESDLHGAPHDATWYVEAIRRGYRSCLALPLAYGGERLGVLVLYSGDPWPSDEDERQILQRLADEVAYGACSLRERRLRREAELDREEAQHRLVEERVWLSELAGSFPGALLTIARSPEGRLTVPFATAAIDTLMGISREELGRDLAPLLARIEAPSTDLLLAAFNRSGERLEVFHGEAHYRHPDKGLRWIEGASVPRRLPDGTVLWHGYLADVTTRHEAQVAAAVGRLRFETLTRTSSDGFLAVDLQGRIIEADDKVAALLGYPVAELLRLHVAEVDVNEDAADVAAHIQVIVKNGSDRFESRYRRKDGTLLDVEVSVRYLEERGGMFLSFMRDIGERKRARQELEQSERRFRALIERSADIILVMDGERRIRFAGPSVLEALGWQPEELVGRTAAELGLIHPDEQPASLELMGQLLRGEQATVRLTFRARHRDGTYRLCEATARDLRDDAAVGGVVINLRDITEKRRLEDQLRQSQKLESIGRLAGGVAHDFNNLLTVILGGAEALGLALGHGSPEGTDLVDEISAAGNRAAELTRQLLAFARKQVIDPRPLDLNAMVKGAEKLLRRVIGEDVELVVEAAPGLWTVRCDPGQIEQVLLNLAVNSRDAMPAGGRLTLSTANVTVLEREAAVQPELKAGPHVRLTVRDTGTGMSPEVLAQLFEPFFTTKGLGQGTGLGLATVYGIVKQSKGAILVESEPGRGSRFDIYFPRSDRPAVAPPAHLAPTLRRGSETVLLVEDDRFVRDVVLRSLRTAGYRVLVASDGEEALARARAEPGGVDLLLTDVVMPGLQGPEVAARLRAERPGVAVLYLSGYSAERTGAVPGEIPGDALLLKPFTAEQLGERVRAVLDRAVASPRVIH